MKPGRKKMNKNDEKEKEAVEKTSFRDHTQCFIVLGLGSSNHFRLF